MRFHGVFLGSQHEIWPKQHNGKVRIYGGSQAMGMQIRDERQMKALTGLSQAQFDRLLPVFSDLYQTTQQQTYEQGIESGTRVRTPGGGSKGT